MLDFMKRNMYDNVISMMIKSEGYERIEKLQLDKQNKKVFVSMAFNSGTDGTRNTIKQGIEAGYDAALMDKIINMDYLKMYWICRNH